MPLYTFEHPTTLEQIDILQRMKEEHAHIDEEGVEWNRVFTSPNAAIDTRPDIFSTDSLAGATNNKKDSYEDLVKRSQEASEKRAEKTGGRDPVKQVWYDNYAKKRQGKRHQSDPKFDSAPNG